MSNLHYINNQLDAHLSKLNAHKFIVIDRNVYQLHREYVQALLDDASAYLIIEAEEKNKNKDTIEAIYEMLLEHQANRHDYLIAIGGGLIMDLAGYAAATFYRGMSLINVPTTLLAQVDAAIGGKVGYNMQHHKNLIGTFYEANEVIIDRTFLASLTDRLFKEGLIELLKYGFIKEPSILEQVVSIANLHDLRNNDKLLDDLIKKAIATKQALISDDYYDTKQQRALLNFGHTFGHAIELDNDLYHGEAVAMGMLVEAYPYPEVYQAIKDVLEKFACLKPVDKVNIENIKYDKKITNQKIAQVAFEKMGEAKIVQTDLDSCLKNYAENYQLIKDQLHYTPALYEFYPMKLKGQVDVPVSKSQLHRYIIGASLSQTKTVLNHVDVLNDDVLTTLEAVKTLGTTYQYNEVNQQLTMVPCSAESQASIKMNESGTSLRLLLPSLIHLLHDVTIETAPSLSKRPMSNYDDIFKANNIEVSRIDDDSKRYQGAFEQYDYQLSGQISSQFISGLLFLLPLLDQDTSLTITDEIVSLPYVKLTIDTLKAFGINVKVNDDYTKFSIAKNQSYRSKGLYDIEIDYSALAFWNVAQNIGNDVKINNDKNDSSSQGDKVIKKITQEHLTNIDVKDTPDLFPILCVYLSTMGGTFTNIERLKYKESNRLQAMLDIFTESSIAYKLGDNQLTIQPGTIKGGHYDTHHDHRIAMSLIIAATIADGKITLSEIKSINKSYPNFINTYLTLGGKYNEI